MDWTRCPELERLPGKGSGAWLFRGTRVPVKALFENIENGATVDQFLEWFTGVGRRQVDGVISAIDRLPEGGYPEVGARPGSGVG